MTFGSCSHGMVREETRLQQGLTGKWRHSQVRFSKNVGLKGSWRRERDKEGFLFLQSWASPAPVC